MMKSTRPTLKKAAGCPGPNRADQAAPSKPEYPTLKDAAGCPNVNTRHPKPSAPPERSVMPISLNPRISDADRRISGRIGITLQQLIALRCRGLLDTEAQIQIAREAVAHLRTAGRYSYGSVVDVIAAVLSANGEMAE